MLWLCSGCKRTYGDPMYKGPIGHAPQTECLDCWEIHKQARPAPTKAHKAYNMCLNGFSHRQIGAKLKCSHVWVGKLIRQIAAQ